MTETTPAGPVLAPAGPVEAPAVVEWLKVHASGKAATEAELAGVVAAVNRFVRRLPPGPPADGQAWDEDVALGALMLAGRLWARRNSPAGVAQFGSEGAAYVQRQDPDVAMLLGLGAWARPVAG